MTKKLQNKKGFTLTELIVVIVIIGILAAVLIPTLTGYISKAKETAAEQEATAYVTAYNSWIVEKESGLLDESNDTFEEYCQNELKLTDGTVVSLPDETDATKIIGFTYTASNKIQVKYVHGTGLEVQK